MNWTSSKIWVTYSIYSQMNASFLVWLDSYRGSKKESKSQDKAGQKQSSKRGSGTRRSTQPAEREALIQETGHDKVQEYLEKWVKNEKLPSIQANARLTSWPYPPVKGSVGEYLQNIVRRAFGAPELCDDTRGHRQLICLGTWAISESTLVSIVFLEPMPSTVTLKFSSRYLERIKTKRDKVEIVAPSSSGRDNVKIDTEAGNEPCIMGRKSICIVDSLRLWARKKADLVFCNYAHTGVAFYVTNPFLGNALYTTGAGSANRLKLIGEQEKFLASESAGDLVLHNEVGKGKGGSLRMNANGNFKFTGHPASAEKLFWQFAEILRIAMEEDNYDAFSESWQRIDDIC